MLSAPVALAAFAVAGIAVGVVTAGRTRALGVALALTTLALPLLVEPLYARVLLAFGCMVFVVRAIDWYDSFYAPRRRGLPQREEKSVPAAGASADRPLRTASSTGPAVRRRKRYEEIAEHIELLIHSDRIGEGGQLPSERELMERFGVGRSTVREALFMLQRMGLVQVNSGAPARVTLPTAEVFVSELSGAARLFLGTPQGMRQFQHARALFEIGLAREAATDPTPETSATLGAALEANRQAIGDPAAFEQTDLDFHSALAATSGNPIFVSLTKALNEWLAKQRAVSIRAGASHEEVYAQHKAIHDAIVGGAPEAAMAAMQAHLDFVVRMYWQAVTGEGAA